MIIQAGLSLLFSALLSGYSNAQAGTHLEIPASDQTIGLTLDISGGRYMLWDSEFGWAFNGKLDGPVTHAALKKGRDLVGPYSEIVFDWKSTVPVRGSIRTYEGLKSVFFRASYLETAPGNGIAFPNLTCPKVARNSFSYKDDTFAPPTFGLAKTATPWVLFDDRADCFVISPASSFMVSTMVGDTNSDIGVGLQPQVKETPRGFNQDSVLSCNKGIGATCERWGSVMQKLFRKRSPANDADTILKNYGYWTDNGADYYYNYDPGKGYADTLVSLVQRYQQEGIPLGYLQLDSWWYQKSTYDPSGRRGGAKKNNRLPIGSWNRYGGLMEYRAHPDLFPHGLSDFQQTLGLPLAVHNRWIDRNSPYHEQFKISGVGAIDSNWWTDTVGYLKRSGVICYEQDWLDEIYLNSPEMASVVGVGDAFTNAMADACSRSDLTMQYCMGTPRFFLQGLKYSNLTTIRTSGDRFEPRKWADFLYVSRLAHDVGIWPWCDVFKSSEQGNMTLAVLSAGPVGTGDAIGKENKQNILQAARLDGVIVKPDQPLLPSDQTYLDGAAHRQTPFVASTFTDHGGFRTNYVFTFPRSRNDRVAHFRPSEFGVKERVYAYNVLSGEGRVVEPSDEVSETIGKSGYAYFMMCPITEAGVTLIGDLGKIVPTGKQRIQSITRTKTGLRVVVSFAKGEQNAILEVECPRTPIISSPSGSASIMSLDSGTGRFSVAVRPLNGKRSAEILISN